MGDFGVSHIFENSKKSKMGVHRLASVVEAEQTLSGSSADVDGEGNGEGTSSSQKKRQEESVSHDDDELYGPEEEEEEEHPHPPNVLNRMDTDAALAMTGMANHGLLTKTEGTWCFWSPEMCEGSQAFSGYAADMWAAGVCLYIFVTGKLPFYSEVPTELFEQISSSEIKYEGLGLSHSLVDLLKRCLEKDPAKRAGVGDCLKHPFLQEARTKRIFQLSTEFEISRKRKIVLNEEDIKAVSILLIHLDYFVEWIALLFYLTFIAVTFTF